MIHKKDKEADPEIKRAVMVHAPPPKPKRAFPWYVHNVHNNKWAVIDSADISISKDTIWEFYGSMDRYEHQTAAQASPQSLSSYVYGPGAGYGFFRSTEDTILDAPLGGEFQFATLDSAKIYYHRFKRKKLRDDFVADSTKKRNEFIQDSIFRHEHTYKELDSL